MVQHLQHHQSWLNGNTFRLIECLVDTDQLIGQLEHVVPQGDDYELCVLGAFLDIVAHDLHVTVIESSVYLIKEIQGSGSEVVQCKYQG